MMMMLMRMSDNEIVPMMNSIHKTTTIIMMEDVP